MSFWMCWGQALFIDGWYSAGAPSTACRLPNFEINKLEARGCSYRYYAISTNFSPAISHFMHPSAIFEVQTRIVKESHDLRQHSQRGQHHNTMWRTWFRRKKAAPYSLPKTTFLYILVSDDGLSTSSRWCSRWAGHARMSRPKSNEDAIPRKAFYTMCGASILARKSFYNYAGIHACSVEMFSTSLYRIMRRAI